MDKIIMCPPQLWSDPKKQPELWTDPFVPRDRNDDIVRLLAQSEGLGGGGAAPPPPPRGPKI